MGNWNYRRAKRRTLRWQRRLLLETLEQRLALTGYDFGDAPTAAQSGSDSSYPTLSTDEGASHLSVGPQLGVNRSESAVGQPNVAANGDSGANGSLSFEEVQHRALPRGENPVAWQLFDVDNDSELDLVAVNSSSNDLTIQLGVGSGEFGEPAYIDLSNCESAADVNMADINLDGEADAVVACNSSHQLRVLLGRGDGTFQVSRRLDLNGGRNPNAVGLADFNGDGSIDIAATNGGSRDVSILLGHGNGSFRPAYPVGVPSGASPWSLATGDIDGDGRQDLVTGGRFDEAMSVLYGRGDGTFDAGSDFSFAGVGISRPRIVDLDKDGRNDLIGRRFRGSVVVLYGKPDRAFELPQHVWTGGDTLESVPVDVNADGILDLVAGNSSRAGVSVTLGRGNRQFGAPHRIVSNQTSVRVAAADLNGDGAVDVVTNNGSSFTRIMGNGDGTFQTPASARFVAGERPASVAAADFDKDGFADVAVANSDSDDIAIFKGVGDGSLGEPTYLPLATGIEPVSIVASDVNGDSFVDLVVSTRERNGVSLFLGRPGGDFAREQTVWLHQGRQPEDVLATDIDGDGRVDLATADKGSSTISLLFGDGTGGFTGQASFDVGSFDPTQIASGDFDNDGRIDFATANNLGGNISVLLAGEDGTPAPAFVSDRSNVRTASIIAADLTGDGNVDLVTGHERQAYLTLWRGKGDGQFVAEQISIRDSSFHVAIGIEDLNQDGELDLVAANTANDYVEVIYGLGSGQFGESQRFDLPFRSHPQSLAIADLNGDGRQDLITANDGFGIADSVTTWLNTRSSFQVSSYTTSRGNNAAAALTGDFNGDQILDLATANRDSNDISLRLGYGDGTFHDAVNFNLRGGKTPVAIASADFNRDGLLDIATANNGTNHATVFFGHAVDLLSAPVHWPLGQSLQPTALVAADLDADSFVDLAVLTEGTDDVSILWGDGEGAFALGNSQSLGLARETLSAGDVNNDGLLDLVAKNDFQAGARLLINSANRTFEPVEFVELMGTYWSQRPTLGDLDGDGNVDLISVNVEYNNAKADAVLVRRGNGDGTFGPVVTFELGTNFNIVELKLHDLDGDGSLDVLLGNSFDNALSVMLNNGTGGLLPAQHYDVSASYQGIVSAVTIADLNGDSVADVTLHSGSENQAQLLLGNGDGTLRIPQIRLQRGDSPFDSVALDLNDDGLTDFITANWRDLSILMANAPGSFDPPLHVDSASGSWQIEAGDVTGDGQPDIVLFSSGDEIEILQLSADGSVEGRVFLSPGFQIEAGELSDLNGDGVFDIVVESHRETVVSFVSRGDGAFSDPIGFDSGLANSEDIALDDFTGDGVVDVVVGKRDDGGFVLGIGNGDGSFVAGRSIVLPDAENTQALASGDFNEDGNIDLVGPGSPDVHVVLGNGDGTFELGVVLPLRSKSLHTIEAVDINLDGHLDLVSGAGSSIKIFYGVGNGTFNVSHPPPLRHLTSGISVADINLDGRLDIASQLHVTNEIGVLYQGTNGALAAPQYIQTDAGSGPELLSASDLNADGVQDVIVWSTESDDLAFLLGYGDGTFQQPTFTLFPASGESQRSRSFDFDHDGRPDRVTIDTTSQQFSIARGMAGGTLADAVTYALPTQASIQADLNRDGLNDDVSVSTSNHAVDVSIANADGSQRDWNLDPMPTGENPRSTVFADVNNDGTNDIITANGSRDITTFLVNEQNQLSEPVVSPIGFYPGAVSVVDLNADGWLDLAFGAIFSGEVDALYGDGTGQFEQHEEILISEPITGVVDRYADVLFGGEDSLQATKIADLDSDGRIDVVGYDFSESTIVVRLQNEDGSFADAVAIDSRRGNIGLSVGDLNSDGILDIASANTNTSIVSLFYGVGDGTFLPAFDIDVDPNLAPREIASGDIDGDGVAEVFLTTSGHLAMLQRMPDGTYSTPSLTPLAGIYRQLHVADLNNDTQPAIVIVSSGTDSIEVVTPDGTEIQVASRETPIGSGVEARKLSSADINHDGFPDAITLHETDVIVHLGADGGSLQASDSVRLPEGGATDVAIVDWDGDSHLDLLTANEDDNSVWLLLGRGDGTLEAPIVSERLFASGRIATGDFNRDGRIDFAVGTPEFSRLNVVLQQTDGSIGSPLELSLGDDRRMRDIAVGDFNGDTFLDIATSNNMNDLSLLFGNGDGGWQLAENTSLPASQTTGELTSGDLNVDGFDDLIVGGSSSYNFTVLMGGPDGPEFAQQIGLPARDYVRGLVVEDGDRDGNLDVVVNGNSFTAIYYGGGDGSLSEPHNLAVQTDHVAVLDLNRDDRPDILGLDSEGLVIVTAEEQREYELPATWRTSRSSQAATSALADFNDDGILDLAISHIGSDDLSILLGLPDGTFQRDLIIEMDSSGAAFDVVAADLDGDGIRDLLTANANTSSWNWLRGTGNAKFATPVQFHDQQASLLATGDLNHDGRLDVVVGHRYPHGLSIWLSGDDGSLALQEQSRLANSRSIITLLLTDLDRDKNLDIVAQDLAGVHVLLGDGAGGFAVGEFLEAAATSLVAGEFNGDSQTDLALAVASDILLYEGIGDGTFGESTSVGRSGFGELLGAGDLNGDGQTDLLASTGAFTRQEDGSFVVSPIDLPRRAEWAHLHDQNQDGTLDLLFGEPNAVSVRLAESDDDGIEWLNGAKLPAGGRGHVRVELRDTDGRSNYLNGWIDFNRDGDWNDEDEQIFSKLDLGPGDGYRYLDFAISEATELGTTYARFRLSSRDDLLPSGPADDGEVEDYRVEIVAARDIDYGDAPIREQTGFTFGYSTAIEANGARHLIGGPRLGALVDAEPDGVPGPEADRDDSSGEDDEDGVEFGSLFAGATATATINVTGADGRIDAWIDFNSDGDWIDPDEQIATDFGIPANSAREISFSVPTFASATVYARIRVSSDGGLSPTGLASDGEVEDYRLTITEPSQQEPIDVGLSIAADIAADARLLAEGNELVVQNHGVVIFRRQVDDIPALALMGTRLGDRIDAQLPPELRELITIDAGEGRDLLRAIDHESGDLWMQPTKQAGFEVLDLRNGVLDILRLDELDAAALPDHVYVYSDAYDSFAADSGWQLATPVIDDGNHYRRVERGGVRLLISSTAPWRNPTEPLDVSGNMSVEPLDALQIINGLNARLYPDGLPDPAAVAAEEYRYLDTTGDGHLSPLDVLVIINFLNGVNETAEAEAPISMYLLREHVVIERDGRLSTYHLVQESSRPPASDDLWPAAVDQAIGFWAPSNRETRERDDELQLALLSDFWMASADSLFD